MLKAANNREWIPPADDDRPVIDILATLLESRGYNVMVAHSGAEALAKAVGNTDPVLLNITLPDQGGFPAYRKLNKRNETRNVSIVILTGKLLPPDIIEGLCLVGADGYPIKLFECGKLVARMEAVACCNGLFRAAPVGSFQEEEIVSELRRIIDEELIIPFFQPIYFLNPIQIFGFESLSRPKTESMLRAPDLLFEAAIHYGLYYDVEILSWQKSMKYASERLKGKKLFLNCSPYLIEGPKLHAIQTLIRDNNINVQDVYLEITERSAISDFKAFYKRLKAYRKCGFKFAVDDVGCGYASLESIVETKPEVIKIDRHIIHDLSHDAFRRGIVKLIVAFCRENNIVSVAEGVETKEDLEIVIDLGVDAGQGYYLCRPLPRIDLEEIVPRVSFPR